MEFLTFSILLTEWTYIIYIIFSKKNLGLAGSLKFLHLNLPMIFLQLNGSCNMQGSMQWLSLNSLYVSQLLLAIIISCNFWTNWSRNVIYTLALSQLVLISFVVVYGKPHSSNMLFTLFNHLSSQSSRPFSVIWKRRSYIALDNLFIGLVMSLCHSSKLPLLFWLWPIKAPCPARHRVLQRRCIG